MTNSADSRVDRRWLVYGAVAIALVIAVTVVAKYRLIEPMAYAAACERHEGPWLGCQFRASLILLFFQNLTDLTSTPFARTVADMAGMLFAPSIAGMSSAVLGILATLARNRGLALAAVAVGGSNIVLYHFDSGVIGVMLGLLVIAREAARGKQQATGEGEPQSREV
jgi:hypothetical protein